MRTISQIADDVQARLTSNGFPTVRLSTAAISAQLINELKAISAGKLPAVIVVIGDIVYDETVRKQSINITLVLIDRFIAGSDERAISVLTSLETLMASFPPDTIAISEVHYRMRNAYAASGDPNFVCFGLAIEASQKTF